MSAVGVLLMASGVVLLIWTWGPVRTAASSQQPGPATLGPPSINIA